MKFLMLTAHAVTDVPHSHFEWVLAAGLVLAYRVFRRIQSTGFRLALLTLVIAAGCSAPLSRSSLPCRVTSL